MTTTAAQVRRSLYRGMNVDTQHIAGAAQTVDAQQAPKSHWPISSHDLPDYALAMRLVRPYRATQGQLTMMWVVGQLQQLDGSTSRDSLVKTLAPSVHIITRPREELWYPCPDPNRVTADEVKFYTGKLERWMEDSLNTLDKSPDPKP